jgi:hypothetical protein
MSAHTAVQQGSCHCGAIRFTAQGVPDSGLACNCSICQRRGSLLWFLPQSAFTLQTDPAAVANYTFNKHAIQHRFCARCGIHVYGEGKQPDGTLMVAVNLRCLEDFDLAAVPVHHYDGRAL